MAGLLLAAGTSASASTILYNNTGSNPPPTTVSPGGYAISGVDYDYYHQTSYGIAAAFSSPANATLTEIDVYLNPLGDGSNHTNEVVFSLYSDSANVPGTKLASWNAKATAAQLVSIMTGTDLNILAGVQYWLVATPQNSNSYVVWDTSYYWVGPHAYTYTKNGVTTYDVQPSNYASDPEFVVRGNIQSATPEPGTWALLGGGFIAILAFRRPLLARS